MGGPPGAMPFQLRPVAVWRLCVPPNPRSVPRRSRATEPLSPTGFGHGRERLRKTIVNTVVAALCIAQLLVMLPGQAQARVNPLSIIKRQIHKANILVVMDTSGSMTGVPGGTFTSATEVGVDCDEGTGCRGWDKLKCKASGKACLTNNDCNQGTCSQSTGACVADRDCPAVARRCSASNAACASNADCGAAPEGICAATKDVCSGTRPCAAVSRCQTGNEPCPNPGGLCAALGTCQGTVPPQTCLNELECPQWGDQGKCAATGAPCNGPCPSAKICNQTGETCDAATPCPRNRTRGTCAENPTRQCSRDSNCKKGCVFATNLCSGPDNFCKHPHRPCQVNKTNQCVPIGNACAYPANTCVGGGTNTCVLASKTASDVCIPPAGTAGPVKMCRLGMTVCTADKDCIEKLGDTCGAPTSRAVIAKRVLKRIVEDNFNIANFGLMTFYQSGYFPYFTSPGAAAPGEQVTVFASRTRLMAAGCYDGATLPKASCTLDGKTYTRRITANSRYLVFKDARRSGHTDQDFCGEICPVKPGYGSGRFEGSYYVQTAAAASGGAVGRILQPKYDGPIISVAGKNYSYYAPNSYFYNGGERPTATPGFLFNDCASANACSAKCGGSWNASLVPFLDVTDNPATSRANALAISARLEKASAGGLVTYSSTPSGCTLENDSVGNRTDPETVSAYHYMDKVIKQIQATSGMNAQSSMTCRPNYVIFVTDGAANGPGDIGPPSLPGQSAASLCSTAACAANDPVAAGCKCRAVLAAFHLRKNLGVRTLVVGFSGDVSAGEPRIINDNIARAGGTDDGNDGAAPFAFTATNEDDLADALQRGVYEAAKGSYSTSPATASSGQQLPDRIANGKYVLDSRVDFPSWAGHLVAYDVSVQPAAIIWDAAAKIDRMNWWQRRVYIGTATGLVRILIDQSTHAVTNAADLFALGLGASAQEASDIVHFMLGDDAFKNPAALGALINSTPIDVGPPFDSDFPGATAFHQRHKNRTHLTYVGSSDGMLHALFTEDAVIGGTTYEGGSEAFAYIPTEMLPVLTRLYVQKGQIPDPERHVFGIANSAKVRNICTANCTSADTAIWKTVLVMPEGYGGNKTFALDITAPISSSGVADPPVSRLWSTGDGSSASSYETALGQTISVPAFFFDKTDTLDGYRMISTSGYPTDPKSTTQGRQLVIGNALTGALVLAKTIPSTGGCPQELTTLTDVATARDYWRDTTSSNNNRTRLLGAYFGDTWGGLWRSNKDGGLTSLGNSSWGDPCDRPLHFSPTLVQLDRNDPTNHKGDVYLVQVTNSALDDDTIGRGTSKMILLKDHADAQGAVARDMTFGIAGTMIVNVTDMCAVMNSNRTCTLPMPSAARPSGTPTAVLKEGGQAFKIFSLWFVPSPFGCGKGNTYLTVHEVAGDQIAQTNGISVAPEAVQGTVFAGNKVMTATATGLVEVGTALKDFVPKPSVSAGSSTSSTSRYIESAWIEID